MKLPYLRAATPQGISDWAKQVITLLNGVSDQLSALPGPFSNDAAAAAANVGIGAGYIDTAGIARRRIV